MCWPNTLGRSSVLVSGNTWIGTLTRRLLASLNITLLLSRLENNYKIYSFGNVKVSSVGVFSADYSII